MPFLDLTQILLATNVVKDIDLCIRLFSLRMPVIVENVDNKRKEKAKGSLIIIQ